jgi:hypothetical protein
MDMKSKHHRGRCRKRHGRKPGEKSTPQDFYRHFAVYLAMGAFFFFLNLFTAPGSWWFYWPMLGWGIGLFFHFLATFVLQDDAVDEEYKQLPLGDAETEEELELKEPQKKWSERDLV